MTAIDETSNRSRSHDNVSHPSHSPQNNNSNEPTTTDLNNSHDENNTTNLNENDTPMKDKQDFDNRSHSREKNRSSSRNSRGRHRSRSDSGSDRSHSRHKKKSSRERDDSRDRSTGRRSSWKNSSFKGDDIYDPCKLFVGGIPRDVDENRFREFFSKYGKVADVQIIRDYADKSRGFGFVIMRDEEDAKTILSSDIEIEPNRKLDVKQALPKSKTAYYQNTYGSRGRGSHRGYDSHRGSGRDDYDRDRSSRDSYRDRERERETASDHHRTRGFHKGYSSRFVEIRDPNTKREEKIFIGGLPEYCTTEDMEEYFSKWGKINDSIIMLDGNGRSRRFGFITFKYLEDADKCLEEKIHTIKHTKVTISRAVPKKEITPGHNNRYNNNNNSSSYRERERSSERYRNKSRERRDRSPRNRDRSRERNRRDRTPPRDRDRRRSRSRDRGRDRSPRYRDRSRSRGRY